MSWVAVIGGVATVGGALINKSAANKNASAASNLQYQPIDLAKLQSDAQATAVDNATKSLQLEAQLRPDLAGARSGLDSQVNQDLQAGGNLPTDVINQVTRGSVAGANTAGLVGGGGPLTAANLGLTAMQVRNNNQAKAENLLAANPLPTAGLDPGSLASAAIGQNNAMNQFNLYKSGVMANANQSSANANSGLLGGLGTLAGSFLGNKSSSSGGGAGTIGVTG